MLVATYTINERADHVILPITPPQQHVMSTLHASSVWPVCQSGALWDQPGSSETELAAILLAHTDAACVCAGRICCAPLRPWCDASSSISASSARAPSGTVDAPVIALLLEEALYAAWARRRR